MNTYTKLKSGEWGISVDGKAIPGNTYVVATKSGKNKEETVASVLWHGTSKFSGGMVSICSIFRKGPAVAKTNIHFHPRSNRTYWICPMCEEENPMSSRNCWECGCGRR